MNDQSLLPPAPTPPALPAEAGASEPSLPQLLRALLQDGQTLIRQELELARLEIQRSASRLARQSAFVAAGGFLIALGLLVLLVFVILALGVLLGDRYWLSTLIVGTLLCVGGLGVVLKGRRGLKEDSLKPDKTLQSLQETGTWAKAEAAEMKRDLTEPQRERL
jgi:uncharacterized membrane protein YqjE